MKKITGVLVILFVLISCGVQQEVRLSLEGGGRLILDVELEQVFVDYLFDIAEATTEVENPEDLRIFDVEEIKKSLEAQPGVKVVSVKTIALSGLHLEMTIADLNTLARSLGEEQVFSLKEEQGVKTFRFHLDKKGYGNVKKLFPFLTNPVFDNLAPKVDEPVTRDEYLEILEFAMEEDGVKAASKSNLDVKVFLPGTLVSQKGGIVQNNNIVLRIPLLDVLLLNDPVNFEAVYR